MRGSVRRSGRGSWEIRFELGSDPATGRRLRRYETIRAATKADAEAHLAARLHELATGTLIAPTKLTVAAFLEQWLANVKQDISPLTHKRYAEMLRLHVVPAIGTIPFMSVRPAHILQAQAMWRVKLAPVTVLKIHRVLSKMFSDAVKWQVVSVNPCAAVSAPRAPHTEMHALDPDQARTLLAEVVGAEYGPMIAFLLFTGARLSEAIGLRWVDVDFDAGTIQIVQGIQRIDGVLTVTGVKSHRSRRAVAMAPQLAAVLREHRSASPDFVSGLVFNDPGRGGPVRDTAIRWAFYRALGDAGLPRVRLHDLRHTCGSLLVSRGVDAKVVSEILGHASVAFTMDRYVHSTPSAHRDAAARLANLLA